MGAVPRKKVTRHQRGNRRRHQYLTMPKLVVCPECGALMQAHRVCKACGTYKGREVIPQKETKTGEK
jgi:large subunit ribosomal protein L32